MSARRTYLDFNATAPLGGEARAAMLAALELQGNPSSVHAEGRQTRAVVEAARADVARLVGARPADVVFTSGATEANAWVMAGGWRTIYMSDIEHDSVRGPARASGAEVVPLPATADGEIDAGAFARLVLQTAPSAGRALVSVQAANNETGVVQPVAEMANFARAHGIAVHCDAVQAPGRLAVDIAALGADYLSISAHKLGGPKGTGALVLRDGAVLSPLIRGGGQERGRRAGTENVAAIAGFGAAAAAAVRGLGDVRAIRERRDALAAGLRRATPGMVEIGSGAPRLANTLCVALSGMTAETMVIRLDLAGVAVSAGAACSSGKVSRSTTLAAMGIDDDIARCAVRFSLGRETTDEDIAHAVTAWRAIAAGTKLAA